MITTTKKEIIWIIIAILIMGFIISFSLTPYYSPIILLYSAIIIITSILVKKIAGEVFNIRVEHKIWELKQFWYSKRGHFKNPVPIGLIIPFFLSIITLGFVKPFILLQFEGENLYKKRIQRKRGEREYRREEINDSDFAFTAAWGFWALILLAIIASYLNQPELAKYSIYYGFWNLLPLGQLDGSKLFFGSMLNWVLLLIAYIISLIIVLV